MSSGIEITEVHSNDDVFPSSSPKGEYVSLEGCGCHKVLTNATKTSSYSPVNFCHKGLFYFSTTTAPQTLLGFQESKSNKLLTFTSMNLRRELKPMQWKEQLILWSDKRGRTKEIHEELQDLDLLCSPHLEER
jgi:hypothetical protein